MFVDNCTHGCESDANETQRKHTHANTLAHTHKISCTKTYPAIRQKCTHASVCVVPIAAGWSAVLVVNDGPEQTSGMMYAVLYLHDDREGCFI